MCAHALARGVGGDDESKERIADLILNVCGTG
jgi:hypothetical protein